MARRIAPVNGVHINGDNPPPPSTLAAQIVQNQNLPAATPQDGETSIFRQLLHELLHNPAVAPETDVDTNVRLISVVAEAGLAPLTNGNPFAQLDVLIPQAVDSIAVIAATIKRQPQVLFTPTAPNEPHLLLPLLARLFAVCGRKGCQSLPVRRILNSILAVLSSSLEQWQTVEIVRSVIDDCVDDAISSLETFVDSKTHVSLALPPARSIAKLWPRSEESITLPQNCQTMIDDSTQIFILTLELSKVQHLALRWRSEVQLRLQKLAPQLISQLGTSSRREAVLQELLSLPNCSPLMMHLLEAAQKGNLSLADQTPAAKALVSMLRHESSVVRDHLLGLLISLASHDGFEALHEDLKIAIVTTVSRFCRQEVQPPRVLALVAALRQDNVMTDSDLLAAFRELSLAPSVTCSYQHRRKRPKTDQDPATPPPSGVIRRVTKLLTGVTTDDVSALPDVASSVYRSLSNGGQCTAWQALHDLTGVDLDLALRTVAKLVGNADNHRSKEARVFSMVTIRACIEKTNNEAYIDLGRSEFGQMCLRSLQSSVRELRVASGQCLAGFLRKDLPAHLRAANCKAVLDHLRRVSDQDVASEQETLVSAWGQVAQICEDTELNLALLRLVDSLGHPNPLISGLASTELERLADSKKLSAEALFRPFWSSIAVSVVRDLQSRPQKAQQLCELLQIDVNQFLVQTQQETIPSLVLSRKKDILKRIAVARGLDGSIQDLLFQPRTNLTATLALLLAQAGSDPEDATMACLLEVAPGLRETDVVSLVKIDSILVACNLLKYIGDQSDDRKSRVYQAFQIFAGIAERRPGQHKPSLRSSRLVADFFDVHILGIMAHFSHVIENTQDPFPAAEKIRCIRAIAEMIILSKRQVNAALPQIRATLQSAMEQEPLCEASFSAWLTLLPVLEGEGISRILDQTFALILRFWPSLSSEIRQKAHVRIGDLIKNHNQEIQEKIMTIPSLKSIPLFAKVAAEIERLKSSESVEAHCKAFATRLKDESKTVVIKALEELVTYLSQHQEFIQDSATSEQPAPVLSDLLRSLLDVAYKYSADDDAAAGLCGEALGIIGCVDPNRVEAPRLRRRALVISNFERATEVEDWAVVLLEDVLVKAFKSTSNARAQGFLAYVIQELLRFCEFNEGTVLRSRATQGPSKHQKWMSMPEHVRISLTPFVSSRYVVMNNMSANPPPKRTYPGFTPSSGHGSWLRSLVYDLMLKAKGDNPNELFPMLARTIRGHDLAIASFMLPYAILNVVLGGTVGELKDISDEFLAVLNCQADTDVQQETLKLCSESVFSALDYVSTWLQESKRTFNEIRATANRTGLSPDDFDEVKHRGQIDTVEQFLASIPAELIATRAVMCGSYARALFHWEQYIRRQRPLIPSARPPRQKSNDEMLYDRLQAIYAQIDEPDGLEGISAHLQFLDEEQQATQHVKAGRWTAAQSWYELQLADHPYDLEVEEHLLSCFRETGRYEPLLKYADSFVTASRKVVGEDVVLSRLLPSILEAKWTTGDLRGMVERVGAASLGSTNDFNTGIANILTAVIDKDDGLAGQRISSLRALVMQGMSYARTNSIQTSHEDLRKLHVLHDLDALRNRGLSGAADGRAALERRLSMIGSYVVDKQYVLGVQRAMMESMDGFEDLEIGASWLMTAKLARQRGNTEHAYTAVLRASEWGNKGAKIEEARLLWRDGHQRHAINSLETAIASGTFEASDAMDGMLLDDAATRSTNATRSSDVLGPQNVISAKVHLLLAKWLDASGQSQASDMTEKYQYAARHFQRWEKGHYYLGKHYQKLLDAEKSLPKEKQGPQYQSGELTKLVIENLVRSIPFGNKYWHETIPKVLTLWLDLGLSAINKPRQEDHIVFDRRVKALQASNRQLQKYFERVPPYVFYSAVPQMISRISHPNPEVWKLLNITLTRIVSTHPNQALWSLFPVAKATDRVRVERGMEIINRLKDPKTKSKADGSSVDVRVMIAQGQKLCDGLLRVCEVPIEKSDQQDTKLSEDLGFSHKLAPSQLVVPIETTLTTSLPSGANHEMIKRHKAFVQDKVTIESFAEEVLVLSSLQRPRKLTVRGSDGKPYGLLCKPNDDLRKDRRLMEFNGIINRVLKRDAESSKRRLYVKTYAVTPLSEASGIIEWVEGIKPMRDILLQHYARKGIRPNYSEIKTILDQACAAPEHAHIFHDKVLSRHPPVLHEWFTEVYPEPDAWFAARLRYARTAAVMSIAGHVLGLGDRHGENILLEESTGGVFHVDFNCLFDKGRTFDKPELVPFRLTHNMVDAMGPYGYEGPFRKSSELTYRLLRQSKDTLMTVLETFLYDPTTDFVNQKKKKSTAGVPETPQEILESVEGKLKGLLREEKVPLGVEGYVDALIREATSPWNLASMYIGWCAFF